MFTLASLAGEQGLVKRFFNEKEVTSTLVMDALFSGCKQVEEATRAAAGSKVLHSSLCTDSLLLMAARTHSCRHVKES